MDTLRLLSRGTRSKSGSKPSQVSIPSTQPANPQLFSDSRPTKRRKTSPSPLDDDDFFGQTPKHEGNPRSRRTVDDSEAGAVHTRIETRQLGERKALLKQHKIKVAWLQSSVTQKKAKRQLQAKQVIRTKTALFPDPLVSFDQLQSRTGVPAWLARNVRDQDFHEATEVQMAAIPLLTDFQDTLLDGDDSVALETDTCPDLLTAAPTGSGKTLAFLIPTLAGINNMRKQSEDKSRFIKALILAPTKELVGQIVNEGKTLVQTAGIKVSAYTKDMRLTGEDGKDPRTVAKSDILVSTPGILHAAMANGDNTQLQHVQYLILDEADVLLDPLFREQTVGIWKSLANPALQVSLWSATMGSNIEDLAGSIIEQRRMDINGATHTPFIRLVIGLKDSAVPNVQHELIYAATEQGKLMGLRQLLHPSTTSADAGPILRPPFIVFTQTIERAIALHAELLYDIPAEAGGISRIAVLHSNLSDTARDAVMTRFRKGEIWVLITTDLLSRGIDFRGVNGVVNYDIPLSSAAYIHRAGRTGRAGREGGVAVTLYSKDDIPYLKHVANVIAAAQKQGGVEGSGIQQWLLDALPTLSKNDKQKFKKHGIESRTARGMLKDPKAARKARISTNAGFLKREENNRRGAIKGSQLRMIQADDDHDDGDFAGFD